MKKIVTYLCVAAILVSAHAVAAEQEKSISVSVIYFSESGNTRRMAETIVDGLMRVEGIDAKAFDLKALDADYIKASQCVIFGSPTYAAAMAPDLRQWFVKYSRDYDLAGKMGGMFSTANYYHGGSELVLQNLAVQMLAKGMIVYSGGSAYGVPIIHLGPVAFEGRLEDSEDLFLLWGERMATKVVEVFG